MPTNRKSHWSTKLYLKRINSTEILIRKKTGLRRNGTADGSDESSADAHSDLVPEWLQRMIGEDPAITPSQFASPTRIIGTPERKLVALTPRKEIVIPDTPRNARGTDKDSEYITVRCKRRLFG